MSDPRGHQIQKQVELLQKTVNELVATMKMRQWACERAIEILRGSDFTSATDMAAAHSRIAAELYDFVVKPAVETTANADRLAQDVTLTPSDP